MKKIQYLQMRKLNLSKCTTNEEVCELISKQMEEMSYEDMLDKVGNNFVFQEEAAKAIYTGLSMNMNVFLSGPGGYGKSTLIKYILDLYKIPYHTIVGYKDMPVDALLGIPNMPKLLNESEYELNFKSSVFYKPGVLIGEEFTDILPSTAAALKDILTEKGFRNKNETTPSLISSMIIAANKSALEIADDESKKAFYSERFPIKAEVVWKSYTAKDYYALLSTRYPNEKQPLLYFLAKLFEGNHLNHSNTISPRTAIAIAEVYLKKGIDFIKHFDLNLSEVATIGRIANIEFNKKTAEEGYEDIIDTLSSYETGIEKKAVIMFAMDIIRDKECPIEVIELRNSILKRLKILLYKDINMEGNKKFTHLHSMIENI